MEASLRKQAALDLPISPHISLYYPTSPYSSFMEASLRKQAALLYLHISPYISLYLPISPYISLYLLHGGLAAVGTCFACPLFVRSFVRSSKLP